MDLRAAGHDFQVLTDCGDGDIAALQVEDSQESMKNTLR